MSKKSITATAFVLALVAGGLLIGSSNRSKTLARGCFHQVAHKGRGCAALVERGDGKTVLQLTEFATSDRPDLRVLLISADDAFENATVLRSRSFDVGPLQASTSDAEYLVPSDVDVSIFHAVTIWNSRYQVNFTTAPLKSE